MAGTPTETFRALGTTVVVAVARAGDLAGAVTVVRRVLAAVDAAASRFRDDSEIARVNAAGGAPVAVSALFARAARCALRAAHATDGDLDPTIGGPMRVAGYDRDFAAIRDGAPLRFARAGGWRAVTLDEARGTIRVPAGVELDFGATAKALAADLAAQDALAVADAGVLVSIGGDIAIAGPAPQGGWAVRVADDHAAPLDAPGQTVAVHRGGLATSSTTVRRWRRGDAELHHILDPRTGVPAAGRWRTVSVAAPTCLDANVASTTAIIRGERALDWLERGGLPARLVACDGTVALAGGWPVADGAGAAA